MKITDWANSPEDVGPRDFLKVFGFDKAIIAVGGDVDYVAEVLDPVGIERFRDDYVSLEADLAFGKVVPGSPEYRIRRDAMTASLRAVIKHSNDVEGQFLKALGLEEDQ